MDEYILPKQGDNIIRTNNYNGVNITKSLGIMIYENLKLYKENIFLIDAENGENFTYDDILQKCIETASKLKNRGLKPGDIICLCTYNQVNDIVMYIAGLLIGAKVCVLDSTLSFDDINHLLGRVHPEIIFTIANKKEALDIVKCDRRLECEIVVFEEWFRQFSESKFEDENFAPYEVKDIFNTAVIFFSSGTTGMPKGICINHYSLQYQAVIFKDMGYMSEVNLNFASLYWISSVLNLLVTILSGSTRLLCREYQADDLWYIIEKYKVKSLMLSTTEANLFVKSARPVGVNTTSLKLLVVGGSPVALELLLGLNEKFPETWLRQGYGCTETAGPITVFNRTFDRNPLSEKPESCGIPIPGIWYKVVDPETEKILGPNRTGELRIKSRCQMNGYYNMDSRDAWDSDGWLRTGDICYYDEKNRFYVVDRLKEMIKYRGWHVSPSFLEGILHQHPGVKMTVVIGIPDEIDGEHPMALVILSAKNGGVTEDELRRYVDGKVDDRKKLRGGVKFVEELLYTPTGKIKRNELKRKILLEKQMKIYNGRM